MKKENLVHVDYYLDKDVVEWLKKLADYERITVSKIIRNLLLNCMRSSKYKIE